MPFPNDFVSDAKSRLLNYFETSFLKARKETDIQKLKARKLIFNPKIKLNC
jgi:hypothetical protein